MLEQKYITLPMDNQNTPGKIKKCITHMSSVRRNLFPLGDHNTCWVAGGSILSFLLGEKINDYDIFVNDASIIQHMPSVDGHSIPITLNKIKYDVNKIIFANPIECLESFDFTISRAAVFGNSFICHERFFMDITNKELVPLTSLNPHNTLFRMQKFIRMGFNISRENLYKLIELAETAEPYWPSPTPSKFEGSFDQLNIPF